MTGLILCIRDAVPARAAGLATALVTMFAWLGMGSGGYLGGYCFDLSGSYSTSFAGAVASGAAHLIVVLGLGLALRLRRPGRRRAEPLGRGAPGGEFAPWRRVNLRNLYRQLMPPERSSELKADVALAIIARKAPDRGVDALATVRHEARNGEADPYGTWLRGARAASIAPSPEVPSREIRDGGAGMRARREARGGTRLT
jgi:hypothetical protein